MKTAHEYYAAHLSFSSRSENTTLESGYTYYTQAFTWAMDKIKEMTSKGFKLEVFQLVRH